MLWNPNMAMINEDGTKEYVDAVTEENIVSEQDLKESNDDDNKENISEENQQPEASFQEDQQFFK